MSENIVTFEETVKWAESADINKKSSSISTIYLIIFGFIVVLGVLLSILYFGNKDETDGLALSEMKSDNNKESVTPYDEFYEDEENTYDEFEEEDD